MMEKTVYIKNIKEMQYGKFNILISEDSMNDRNCQCDACKLVREMQKENYTHYLCKSANALCGDLNE